MESFKFLLLLILGCAVGFSAGQTLTMSATSPSLAEDSPAWTYVSNVTATTGITGNIFYAFLSFTPADGKIGLHRNNGTIYVVSGNLDKETENTYTMKLQVMGTGAATATADIILTITSVNEAPTLVLPNGESMTIKENESGTTSIYTLSSVDVDTGDTVTYSIVKVLQNDTLLVTGKFNINSDKLRAVHPFNHEAVAYYDVYLMATDAGGLNSSIKVIRVQVSDVNEEPVFPTQGGVDVTGTASINENVPIGTTVSWNLNFGTDIEAIDPDGNPVTYSLDGDKSGLFEAKNVNGKCVIVTKMALDYETLGGAAITMNVLAKDAIGPWVQSPGDFVVTINNLNDNNPVCSPTTYSATITESTAAGTSILDVTCSDEDGAVEYAVSGTIPAKYFGIKANGVLFVKTPFDLEQVTSPMSFIAYAIQGGASATSASISVTVTATGVNEHGPVFTSNFYNFETPCDYYPVPVSLITVGTVSATDADNTTSQMTYAFQGSDAAGYFLMLSTQGTIVHATQLVNFCNDRKILYVFAKDNDANAVSRQSNNIRTRIDTFNGEPHLVDFYINIHLSYFTTARLARFQKVCSDVCQICECRVFRHFAKPGSETYATTLTVYAYYKSPDTNQITNSNQPKKFVPKADLISMYDTNKHAVSLDLFKEFDITGAAETIPAPGWHETTGGQVVISLLCVAAAAGIIGGSVKLAQHVKGQKYKSDKRNDSRRLSTPSDDYNPTYRGPPRY